MKIYKMSKSAKAIAQAGSQAFTSHAGATLEHMSELLATGDLQRMGAMLIAHAQVHPSDREKLISRLPAKVLNHYFFSALDLPFWAICRWLEDTPGWARTLECEASDPTSFAVTVRALASEIGEMKVG